jgi:hypothetical protein
MEPKELPKNIHEKVAEWLGSPNVLHFWKFDETYIVLARITGGADIYCLRIFPVGNSLQLSQDNVLLA